MTDRPSGLQSTVGVVSSPSARTLGFPPVTYTDPHLRHYYDRTGLV